MIFEAMNWTSANWPLVSALAYWVPLSFCALGYTLRTWAHFRSDQRRRVDHGDAYSPTDTIGTLVGRAIVSVLPLANLWAAAFDLAPDFFAGFFKTLGRVLDQPLVPRRVDRERPRA